MNDSRLLNLAPKALILFGRAIALTLILCLTAAPPTRAHINSDWTFIREVNGVNFYYQLSDCKGSQTLLLLVVNSGHEKVAGNWELFVKTDHIDMRLPGFLIPLEGGREISGSCEMQDPTTFVPLRITDPASLELSISATITIL